MVAPDVQLLWWEGCPSTDGALLLLQDTMRELGLDPESIRMVEIKTDEHAEASSFVGSPTILVNGADVQPPEDGEPVGLTCRVYRQDDGRVSPLPGAEQIRRALAPEEVRSR